MCRKANNIKVLYAKKEGFVSVAKNKTGLIAYSMNSQDNLAATRKGLPQIGEVVWIRPCGASRDYGEPFYATVISKVEIQDEDGTPTAYVRVSVKEAERSAQKQDKQEVQTNVGALMGIWTQINKLTQQFDLMIENQKTMIKNQEQLLLKWN